MKKLVVILSLLSSTCFSQTDSIFHYRITIKEINSSSSAKLVQPTLVDLFKTTPTYQEGINSFVFESKENVKKEEVLIVLPLSYNEITYFKKDVLKSNTESK